MAKAKISMVPVLQDLAIVISTYIVLNLMGLHLEWYHVAAISLGMFIFGLRNSWAGFGAGFERGHACGESHVVKKSSVANKDEFDKIMDEITKDFPVNK